MDNNVTRTKDKTTSNLNSIKNLQKILTSIQSQNLSNSNSLQSQIATILAEITKLKSQSIVTQADLLKMYHIFNFLIFFIESSQILNKRPAKSKTTKIAKKSVIPVQK